MSISRSRSSAVGILADEISFGRTLVTAGDEDHYLLCSWRAAVVGVICRFGAIHLKDSVQVLVGPSFLEPHVLQEMPLPTHAHPLEQRHGRRVPAVRYGDDPMEPQGVERVIQ